MIRIILLLYLFIPVINCAQEIHFTNTNKSIVLKNAVADAKSFFKRINQKSLNPKYFEVKCTVLSNEYNEDTSKLNFQDPNFKITANSNDTLIFLNISGDSPKGVANGIYAFIQQVAGIEFRHPLETFYPDTITLPNFALDWRFDGTAKFDKLGFHLHTLHPIEMTKYLLEANDSNLDIVFQYIDWLARNGQNYFEFNLLESIDKITWKKHASEIVDYAHSRGIMMGIDVSFHMIQQKTFMLYKSFPKSMRGKWQQTKKNLEFLVDIGFDIISIETSSTEYSGIKNLDKLIDSTQQYLASKDVKMMSRVHVVQEEHLRAQTSLQQNKNYPNQGFLVHTVMCFGLTDSIAPVYENKNLRHMDRTLDYLSKNSEVWYYPESAYWVSFDNSLPFFYNSYISSRINDIKHLETKNVQGHLTFSSGWEYGYWFIDWMIAQKTWNYNISSYSYPTVDKIIYALSGITKLQDSILKGEQLIKYIPSPMFNDEIKGKFNIEFQPRPKFKYRTLHNDAPKELLDSVSKIVVPKLEKLAEEFRTELLFATKLDSIDIPRDIYLALEISRLRIKHRTSTLKAILAAGYQAIDEDVYHGIEYHLLNAEKLRNKAAKYVEEMESFYRFEIDELYYREKDLTSYGFGYLYPVKDLHFWEREEQQIRKNKYSYKYDNIYNILRIAGAIN